jgi:hypothetical protein
MREYLYSASRVWTAPECPLFEWTFSFAGEQMARILFTRHTYLYPPIELWTQSRSEIFDGNGIVAAVSFNTEWLRQARLFA